MMHARRVAHSDALDPVMHLAGTRDASTEKQSVNQPFKPR